MQSARVPTFTFKCGGGVPRHTSHARTKGLSQARPDVASTKFSLSQVHSATVLKLISISVSPDKLVLNLGEVTGNIWMTQLPEN